jgi:gliding motility-associated-like protein
MRKYFILICFLFITFLSFAQLSSSSGKAYTTFSGVNYVFVFNGINAATTITFAGPATDLKWYKYGNSTPIATGVNSLDQPENATGYVLEDATGERISFWVIDYQKYLASISTFDPENNPGIQCDNLKLLINANVPQLSYTTELGQTKIMPRYFTVKYQTQEWKDAWTKIDKTETIELPATQLSVTAPLCNTTFTLSGDQYAEALGIISTPFVSSMYTAVSVKCHIVSVLTTRDIPNEGQTPSSKAQVNGSSPLDILFSSNGNEPTALYYSWSVYQGNKLLFSTRSEKDLRYTFIESGDYKVKLEASNAYCKDSGSIDIKVTTSALQVPNVFTPNGDGKNDEFRVAYQSLASFQCWIFNRWGRKVFFWTDPQKGWDGTIGGKKAAEGPYFYIIKAVGTDGQKFTRKGDINLLR